MTALFGPQKANAAIELPDDIEQNRYGAVQTWVKDCSATGKSDGTVLDAAFYNRIIGNLEWFVQASKIAVQLGDMTAIYRAVDAVAKTHRLSAGRGVSVVNGRINIAVGTGTLPVLV